MIRVKSVPLASSVAVVIFGGIALTMALNLWKTTNTKEPVRIASGEFAGQPNPSDIRGSYTWQDIEKAFGVSAADAAGAFSFGNVNFAVTERISALETAFADRIASGREIGTDSVRLFVSLLTGLPHEPEAGTALPPRAVEYLEAKGKIDVAGKDRWLAIIVPVDGAATADKAPAADDAAPIVEAIVTAETGTAAKADSAVGAAANAVAPVASAAAAPAKDGEAAAGAGTGIPDASHVAAERTVTGQTTIGDLYDWGLTESEVETALGFKPVSRTDNLRTAVSAAGGSFGTLKSSLQAWIDAKAKK